MADKLVLVVDDSRVARMMTRAAIAKLHPSWPIIEAASGEDALTAIALDQPDYILMDVNMPGIGGIETARQIRSRCPTAVISLLTANIQEPIRQQATGMGIGFMSKPLKDEALAQFLAGGPSSS